MNQNPLAELHKYGQSFRLENTNRQLTTSVELKRLVDEEALKISNKTNEGKS